MLDFMTDVEDYRQLKRLRDRLHEDLARWSEISGGRLLTMMAPNPMHGYTAKRIVRQLDAQLPPGLEAFENTDTEEEALGKLRMPDVFVVPSESMLQTDAIDPHEVSLVVEVVSRSNPDNDYIEKSIDYPAMGIPHYLIVDPRNGTCLHQFEIGTENGRPAYLGRIPYKYGDTIPVGDLQIDTTGLPLYDDGRQ